MQVRNCKTSIVHNPYKTHQHRQHSSKLTNTHKHTFTIVECESCLYFTMEPLSATDTANIPQSLHVKASISPPLKEQPSPIHKIIVVASIAAGIHFEWALQLTLLTPYVQILGTPHMWSSFIWLCGPVCGIFMQPIIGYQSDRCTSRFGRRRPFIAAISVAYAIATFLIGYAADLGHKLGDPIGAKVRPRTIAVFIVGFWIMDLSNNMLQGPVRALLADLAAGDHRKTRTAYALYSFFMAIGNITGSAAGSAGGIHRVLPFTKTKACDENCANIKTCYFISIVQFLTLTIFAITYVKEKRLTVSFQKKETEKKGGLGDLLGAYREVKRPIWILLLVTCFNWIAWFPFFEYNTDWMGREVYGGKDKNGKAYLTGVHAGALGLLLNSAVAGAVSLGMEFLARGVGGLKRLWWIVNFLLSFCLAMTVLVSKLAQHSRRYPVGLGGVQEPLPPPTGIKAAAFTLFSVLGIPLAISYSVPFALASIFSSSAGSGQGLSLAVLNFAIVIPQIVMSAVSGPWDKLFGGGNLPSFVVGAVAATICGVLSIIMLPSPPPDLAKAAVAGGFH